MKYFICIVVLFSCRICCAQDVIKKKSLNDPNKILNSKIIFFVANPTRYVDSSGNVTVKSLVIVDESFLKKHKIKYDESNIAELLNLFQDDKRDLAANVLLYYFTRQDASPLRHYSIKNIGEWRSYRKTEDVEKWNNYFNK